MLNERHNPSGSPRAIHHSTLDIQHCCSVPPIVANLDLPLSDTHRESRRSLVRRRAQRFAIPYAKPGAVPRTFDFVAFDAAAGELATVVRADVFDRIKAAVEIEYDDLRPVDIHDAPLTRRKLALAGDRHPVAHKNRERVNE
jgi:hypothetical protein